MNQSKVWIIEGREFASSAAAARELGFSPTTIQRGCQGFLKDGRQIAPRAGWSVIVKSKPKRDRKEPKGGRVNLVDEVIKAVCAMRRATVDDLLPMFPSRTQRQIRKALGNAKASGAVRLVEKGIPGRNSTQGVWEPGVEKARAHRRALDALPPLASVWDLASERPIEQWPPKWQGGQRYAPLGAWNTPEEV